MGRAKKTEANGHVAELKAEFDQWRATRTTGKRIPPQLWARAVDLATRHGVHHVANVLHLDYAGLKRRMELTGSGQQQVAPEASAPQFVEMFVPMPMPPQAPAPVDEPVRAECVVELVNARGTRMRIELSGAGVASLPALCNAFCAGA
jgi:hypothetical protein